jgi:hypothetical protein
MNELCMALQLELGEWSKACAALDSLLKDDPAASRVAAADGFSAVVRSTAALAAKYAWLTREGREGREEREGSIGSLPLPPTTPPAPSTRRRKSRLLPAQDDSAAK